MLLKARWAVRRRARVSAAPTRWNAQAPARPLRESVGRSQPVPLDTPGADPAAIRNGRLLETSNLYDDGISRKSRHHDRWPFPEGAAVVVLQQRFPCPKRSRFVLRERCVKRLQNTSIHRQDFALAT